VVDATVTNRFKYLRSDKPLAMTDNYEMAVAKASGEYLLFIGDDDGLLPNALAEMDKLLAVSQAKVVRCQLVNYYWPSLPIAGVAHSLTIPLGRGLRRCRSAETIAGVAGFKESYESLPMLLNRLRGI
jgi:hypothetical protein